MCENQCPTGAINFNMKPEEIELHVGSIIIATGFDQFDPFFSTHEEQKLMMLPEFTALTMPRTGKLYLSPEFKAEFNGILEHNALKHKKIAAAVGLPASTWSTILNGGFSIAKTKLAEVFDALERLGVPKEQVGRLRTISEWVQNR
jgi:predicted XRE-type DNA-binding protein